MRVQCHYNMHVHASKQEGRETCAQKQYLTVSKFTAGRETKDERVIYTSPLPGVNIETVEKHMECHQHQCAAVTITHEHCQILKREPLSE